MVGRGQFTCQKYSGNPTSRFPMHKASQATSNHHALHSFYCPRLQWFGSQLHCHFRSCSVAIFLNSGRRLVLISGKLDVTFGEFCCGWCLGGHTLPYRWFPFGSLTAVLERTSVVLDKEKIAILNGTTCIVEERMQTEKAHI